MLGVEIEYSTINATEPLIEKYGLVTEAADLFSIANAEEIQKAYSPLKGKLFSAHAPYIDQCLCSCDENIRSYSRNAFEYTLGVASDLNISRIVLHHNIFPTLPHNSDVFLRMAEYLVKYLEEQQKIYGMEFYIENVLDNSPAFLETIMHFNTNPNINICFDVAHATLSREPIPVWTGRLSRWIRHIHICDTGGQYDDHLACGQGVVNWNISELKNALVSNEIAAILEMTNINDIKKSIDFLCS